MDVIAQKELRNQSGEVLRRVEAGESLVVTVAGRPVAQLVPVRRDRWVGGPALERVFAGPGTSGMADDLEELPAELVDPFAS